MTITNPNFNHFYPLLDPEIAERVRLQEAAAVRPAHLMTPAEVRATFLAGRQPLVRKPNTLLIHDSMIVTRGGTLDVRIYTPTRDASPPFGALVYFHGGGFTNGDLDSHDAVCCAISEGAACVVASVNYRKLPDHPFPAAYEDALDAIEWLYRDAAGYNVDAGRIAVGGDSAGANLALAAALTLRGEIPLKALWLAYPFIGVDFETPSYRENAHAPLLTRERCKRILHDYFEGDLADADWRVAPLLAASFQGLPPALAIAAQLDPIRSDAEQFIERLAETGQEAVLVHGKGMPHGFVKWVDTSESVRRIITESVRILRHWLMK